MASGSTRSETLTLAVSDGRVVLERRRGEPARIGVAIGLKNGARATFGAWTRASSGALEATANGLRVRGTGVLAGPGVGIEWTLENMDHTVATLRRFEVDCGGFGTADGGVAGLKIAYCGAHSRSPHSRSAVVDLPEGVTESSWWVGALGTRSGSFGFVAGALDFTRFATQVQLRSSGLTLRQWLEGWTLEPGESVSLAPTWLAWSDEAPLELLEHYATHVGERHHVKVKQPPCGWGSWGHYLERIDADLMRENLTALAGSSRLRDAVHAVQIDDGWSELLDSQRASASWLPNRRFPSGIAPVASEVRRHGKACGLWLLPFTVNEGSPLAERHAEFLVADEHGEPKRVGGGASYCLDPTHPAAREWLQDLLGRISDWGVRYLKLDFLRTLLMPDPDKAEDDLDAPRSHHGARTRLEAYRRGLELVRESVGPDTFIVGCSAPAGPGVGLIDAHRVGPDIEPAWVGTHSGIRDAARCLAANWFWQGRTWVNDPDYLLATGSVDESRFWATAVALSGGSSIISADLTEMPAWQEELFAMVTPPTGVSARPLDLFRSAPEPRVWHLRLGEGDLQCHLVGLLNWGERPAEMWLDLEEIGVSGPAHVWDVWRSRHRAAEGRVPAFVEAHGAALFCVRAAAAHPQFVGTDVHFAQGYGIFKRVSWSPATHTLHIEASDSLPRPGSAFVHVPAGWRVSAKSAAFDSGVMRCELSRGRALDLAFVPSTSTRG